MPHIGKFLSIALWTFLARPCVDGEGVRYLTKRVQSLLEPVSDIWPKLEPPVHRCIVLKCFHSIAMMLSPPTHPPNPQLNPPFFSHKHHLTFSTEEQPRRLQSPFIYLYDWIPLLLHGLSKKESVWLTLKLRTSFDLSEHGGQAWVVNDCGFIGHH